MLRLIALFKIIFSKPAIPCWITGIRFVAAPIIFWLLYSNHETQSANLFLALALIAGVAEVSDALDGLVARWRGWESDFGAQLDPIADSAYHLLMFSIFAWLGWIYSIFLVIFVAREGISRYVRSRGLVVKARKSGKEKAAWQGVTIITFFVVRWLDAIDLVPFIFGTWLCWAVIIWAATVAVRSGIDYLQAEKGVS